MSATLIPGVVFALIGLMFIAMNLIRKKYKH